MNVIFRQSFARDIKKIRAKTIRQQIQAVIEQLEQTNSLSDLPDVKKLTSDGPYYRIRIGDYRLGLLVEDDTITVVRFLHRRDIYRYFP
ncbi:MAG: type II toxin-antitoxin system RelE/ParE family toxin [Anaerolineae bacterium]